MRLISWCLVTVVKKFTSIAQFFSLIFTSISEKNRQDSQLYQMTYLCYCLSTLSTGSGVIHEDYENNDSPAMVCIYILCLLLFREVPLLLTYEICAYLENLKGLPVHFELKTKK